LSADGFVRGPPARPGESRQSSENRADSSWYAPCTVLPVVSSHSRNAGLPGRRVSDWAGFLAHLGVAAIMVARTPEVSLFLLPSIVHMTVAAGSFLVRDTPVQRERDPFARFVAYAGGFGVFAFVQVASVFRPEWLTVTASRGLVATGVLLGVVGVFAEIWAIWHLRFAFATEPAARRLVTTGPYRLARHPVYSGACLAQVGLLMTRPTIALALVLIGWAVCMALRMRYEEAILTGAFPEYAGYRRRVGALAPWPRRVPGFGVRGSGFAG
jgi:protein-S-isoprenylcysteine O-methyltransferase Ste14